MTYHASRASWTTSNLGLQKASQIIQAHVEDYQTALLEELSPLSVRHTIHTASGLLSFAVRRGHLPDNVVQTVRKVKVHTKPQDRPFLHVPGL